MIIAKLKKTVQVIILSVFVNMKADEKRCKKISFYNR